MIGASARPCRLPARAPRGILLRCRTFAGNVRNRMNAHLSASEFLSSAHLAAGMTATFRAMDVLARFASREGLSADQLADRFLSDVDLSSPVMADRLSATLPFMDAIARIAAELDFEEAA